MSLRPGAQAALEEILGRDDQGIVGVVLSGSAARGMATERSDVEVPEWSADRLLPMLQCTLDGDVAALREMVDAWGDELAVFQRARWPVGGG